MAVLATLLFPVLLTAAPQDPPAVPAPAQPPTERPRIEWQRTLADALAVQQATGLPLLIAVNMDGEVFNERFANTTYRDQDFVAATRGYVCVVASPDRHTERDYDAFGNRIECPRFPGCTCSEHINIEPELFARFFNGTRNAPRHVGVTKDGKVVFDRFLDQSMQTAIDAIGKHRGDATKQPGPTADLDELFRRRDALARRSIETIWRSGDAAGRRKLLAAAANATNEPTDLLRAALRDEDPSVFTVGAMALAKNGGKDALIDFEDALARITTEVEVERALVVRLFELGKTDKAAARLGSHFDPNKRLTVVGKPWGNPWSPAAFDAEDRAAVEAELDRCEAALRKNADDDAVRLQFAIAQLALADLLIRDGGKGPEMWFGDAIASAKKVQDPALAAEAQGVIAYAAYMTGEHELAGKAMVLAQGLVNSERQPSPVLAARLLEVAILGIVNTVYADAEAAAGRSQRNEIDRVLAMMALLRERQVARETALLAGIGLLEFGGKRAYARVLLHDVVDRFPASPKAHERWRNRLLVDLGANGLRQAYAAYAKTAADQPTAQWFAGFASLVAAEQHTRDQRTGEAVAAYGDAIDRFAASAAGHADFADSAHHFMVLALAGRAELTTTQGHPEAAAADLLRAHELRPASLDETDGLQRKPRAIAGRVAAALEKAGLTELAAKLKPILP